MSEDSDLGFCPDVKFKERLRKLKAKINEIPEPTNPDDKALLAHKKALQRKINSRPRLAQIKKDWSSTQVNLTLDPLLRPPRKEPIREDSRQAR